MDFTWVVKADWREIGSPLSTGSQLERDMKPEKVSTKVAGGGYMPQIRGRGGGD